MAFQSRFNVYAGKTNIDLFGVTFTLKNVYVPWHSGNANRPTHPC